VPPQSEIDNWKAGENRIPIAIRRSGRYRVEAGMEHEIVDVCFYQDVFGKWLYYADDPQIVDYIQTGPTPALGTQ
jgi:hypothetical protein